MNDIISIACTQKLGQQIKIKNLPPNDNPFSSIKSWHAGFNYINRKKCLLFMNNMTSYSIFLYGIKKDELSDLGSTLKKYFIKSIQNEGFDEYQASNFIDSENDVTKNKKTHNKVILGSMTDLWRILPYYRDFEDYILSGESEQSIFPLLLNKELNRTPMQCSRKGFIPIDKFKEQIGVK